MNLPKIKEARQIRQMSQSQVAEALMIPQQQYSRYERGENEIPVRNVIALCRLFNVSADYLLELPKGMPYGINEIKKGENQQ